MKGRPHKGIPGRGWSSRATKANVVKDYVAQNSRPLGNSTSCRPYAPDLNPDEFVWNYMKNTGVSKKPPQEERIPTRAGGTGLGRHQPGCGSRGNPFSWPKL